MQRIFLEKKCKSYASLLVYGITFLLLFITVTPLLLLCMYNHPSVLDDYSIFNAIKDGLDFSRYIRPGYRYSTALVPKLLWSFSQNPTLEEIQSMLLKYKLFSLFVVVFFILSVFYVLEQFNSYILKLSKQYFVLLYSLVLFILTNSIQILSSFFYCYVSTSGYVCGLCFLFLFTGVLFKYHFSHKRKVFYSILLTVIGFIINGTVEFYSILLGSILFVYLCCFFYTKRRIDYFINFLFILCFLTVLTFIFPPWLEYKRSVYAPNVSHVHTVKRYLIWINDMYSYFKDNFFSYFDFKILPAMLGISYFILTGIKRKLYIEGAFFIYVISIMISYPLFYTGITEPTKHVSFFPVLNVLLALNTIFIFTCLIQLLQIVFIFFYSKFSRCFGILSLINIKVCSSMRLHAYLLLSIVFYCFYIGIFNAGLPIRMAWKDILKGTAAEYDAKLKKRYAAMTDYSIKNIEVEEIITPQSFLLDPIWSYQKFLGVPDDVNNSIGKFFNKTMLIFPMNNKI